MDDARNDKSYKSPARKLICFFEKSRDQWKSKHHKVKAGVKRLNNRVRFLEKSKRQWKERVKELEKEVAVLKEREQILEQALNSLEKKESMNR